MKGKFVRLTIPRSKYSILLHGGLYIKEFLIMNQGFFSLPKNCKNESFGNIPIEVIIIANEMKR
jgi:hypothetical protein